MKPRVLLDCDGVLAGFVGNWLRLINIEFGTGYVLEDVTGWDICDSLGLVADQRSRAKRLIAECPEFARRHEVLAGSVDGVRALQEIGDLMAQCESTPMPDWRARKAKAERLFFRDYGDGWTDEGTYGSHFDPERWQQFVRRVARFLAFVDQRRAA